MPSTLLTFSQSLLRLVGLARERRLEDFMPEALRVVQKDLGLRAVWWGWVAEAEREGNAPVVHLNGSLGLPEDFADEWAQVADGDDFARSSIRMPGQVLRLSADEVVVPEPSVDSFVKRHDLFHAMALTAPESASGMMFFIAGYRGTPDPAFSETDAVVFGEFAQHLLQLIQQNLREVLALASDAHADSLGLISAQGRPLFLGQALSRQIKQHWPEWDRHQVPAQLLQQFADAPCVMPVGLETLEIRGHGDRFLIRLTAEQSAPLLAPRQRRVAVLYAAGHSYKAIAQTLGLSPATVRTYLRDCYARLGVSNRVALTDALAGAATRARSHGHPKESMTLDASCVTSIET